MPSVGFTLTGVSPTSPLPGIKREILFAQGSSTGAGQSRDVVLVGNKTAGASGSLDGLGLAVNTIQGPIANAQAMQDQFGTRSELMWMYKKYVAVDPNARIYVVAVPEGGGATAASKAFTFATAASATTTLIAEWGGESIEVTVTSGDTAVTQAANLVAKVNQQVYWPFTSAIGGGGSEHIVTFTASNVGPRGDLVIDRIRLRYKKSVATTISIGALTNGATADDFTAALAALEAAEIYYHVAACTATAGVTATDNGVGEYITFINTQALPAYGKSQVVSFGLVGTPTQATTVATSSAANNARAFFWQAEDNDWTPAMIAAHCTAVMRSQQIKHPAANLTSYTNSESTPFQIPDPYDKNDRPTTTEQESMLDGGVSPIGFHANGASYIVRHVTSRSWLGSSATKDFRTREGHIPSVLDYFWAEVQSRYVATRQPHIAADPAKGIKPLKGVTYPSAVKALITGVMDDLAGTAVSGIPLLDPSPEAVARMKASVDAVDMNDGISATADVEPVRHNNKGHFLVKQTGPGY